MMPMLGEALINYRYRKDRADRTNRLRLPVESNRLVSQLLREPALMAKLKFEDIRRALMESDNGEQLIQAAVKLALADLEATASDRGYDGVLGVKISHPTVVDGGVEVVVYENGFRVRKGGVTNGEWDFRPGRYRSQENHPQRREVSYPQFWQWHRSARARRYAKMRLGKGNHSRVYLAQKTGKQAACVCVHTRRQHNPTFNQRGRADSDHLGLCQFLQEDFVLGFLEEYGNNSRRIQYHMPSLP